MLKRQGDVLIVKIKELPGNLKPVDRDGGRAILAYGEVTGHAHAIKDEGAELFTAANDNMYLRVVEECFVTHEEHTKVHLPPGVYKVIKQMQWDSGQVRKVLD